MSHWQPDRLRYKIVLMTSRMSTLRARPPCLAGGTKGSKIAHCSSVRSVAYAFRGWVGMGVLLPQEKTPTMQLRNHLGQDHLPDSLSVLGLAAKRNVAPALWSPGGAAECSQGWSAAQPLEPPHDRGLSVAPEGRPNERWGLVGRPSGATTLP